MLTKLVTLKVAALCLSVVGIGGVAVAASTVGLPDPLHFGDGSTSGPGADPSSSRNSAGTPSVRPSVSTGPTQRVDPVLGPLCRSYAERDPAHRGRALDDPQFDDLVTTAGGKDRDRVDRFCQDLLGVAPGGPPESGPGGGVQPRPSGSPGDRPTRPPGDGPDGNGGGGSGGGGGGAGGGGSGTDPGSVGGWPGWSPAPSWQPWP